jgi:hypothetical protein
MTVITEQPLDTTTVDQETLNALDDIEETVTQRVHIADLMRQGALNTVQAKGWGEGGAACFLSAAGLAARERGLI